MRSPDTIPTSVVVTNNTTTAFTVGAGVKIPAGASNLTIDLSKFRRVTSDVQGDSFLERTWAGIISLTRVTSARASAPLTLVSTVPNVLPLTTADYPVADPVMTKESAVLGTQHPDYVGNKQGPYIASIGTVPVGAAYVDITFSEGVYGVDAVTAAVADFDFVFIPGSGGATAVSISGITKSPSGALTGGETVMRFAFARTGTTNATDSVKLSIKPNTLRDASGVRAPAGSRTFNLA